LGRTPSRSPQKPKAIKQALEKPHPAPEHWRETYNSTREMRSWCPTPVNTMGYMAKWKEMEPRVCRFFLSRSLGSHVLL
jgi:endonuclease-3